MAQLKQATADLRAQIDSLVAVKRTAVTDAISERGSKLVASDFYTKATPEARARVMQRFDEALARVGTETQVALILQIGSNFEASDYPALLDLLTASQPSGGEEGPPARQTVSIRTIAVPGASGVIETESDVDDYLTVLRGALVQALNDGKRITL